MTFRPARWLPGPHAQTLGARVLRSFLRPRYRRVRLSTPDGDFLDLDWWVPSRPSPDHRAADPVPLVVVLHGLEGCSGSGYVVAACRALAARGIRPVALNFRGRSGEPNLRRRSYHSGETGDLAHVLRRLAARRGQAPLGALGFSLGGNVLLKYLGERGAGVPRQLGAAAAVSVPYDLAASADHLASGAARVYAAALLRSLRSSVRRKARRFPRSYDLQAVERARTLREFDEVFTAPVHGFEDAAHYYRQSSSARYLPGIRTPTLLIQAEDDPFVPARSVPTGRIRANSHLSPAFTACGGHVGFVAGSDPARARYWAEVEAAEFLARELTEGGKVTRSGRRQPGEARAPG